MSAAPKASDKSEPKTSNAEEGFTAEERAAMKQRAAELRAAKRRGSAADKAAAEERDVLAKIAELPESDRAIAERLHGIITAAVPGLAPKLWYGMPAYSKDGKMLCFFQSSEKFKTRYAELGFSDHAKLDDGAIWPVAYAVTELGETEAAKITALVRKAAG